jgi:hypothetical protein
MSAEPIKIYSGPERRSGLSISRDQLDSIAEHAAERAIEKMKDAFFKELGRKALQFLIWLGGALVVGVFAWAQSSGLLRW